MDLLAKLRIFLATVPGQLSWSGRLVIILLAISSNAASIETTFGVGPVAGDNAFSQPLHRPLCDISSTQAASTTVASPSRDAAAGFSWGSLAGTLLAQAIIAIITVISTLRIRGESAQKDIKHITKTLENLTTSLDKLDDKIDTLEQARSACELRSVRSYATREEFVRVITEYSTGNRQLSDAMDALRVDIKQSIGKVHGRCDDLSERVARAHCIRV